VCDYSIVQEANEVFGINVGLPEYRAKRPGGKVSIAVYRDDNESASAGLPQIVVAAAYVRECKTVSLKRLRPPLTTDGKEPCHGTATSTCTTSGAMS
jgi:hypothetical protein